MENPYEERKKELEKMSKKMRQIDLENLELFTAYGTTPQELLQLLRDEANTPKVLFTLLQKQRKYIEETLERRIDAAQAATITEKEKPFDIKPEKHWIFIR